MRTETKPETRHDVIARDIASISRMAEHSFAEHKITLRHRSPCCRFASWRCQKQGTWMYGFDVTIEPGRLMVFGDIGDCVWERTEDMLGWARGSIESIGYFAEKVVREIETECYSSDVAEAWVKEQLYELELDDEMDGSEKSKQRERIEGLLTALEDGEVVFTNAVYESGLADGCDWPNFNTFTPSFMWCREAVKWFLENHND